MAIRRNRKLIHNINVTPFVDVMLVLLIIFMVTSPMLVTGIDIDLPTSSAGPIAGKEDPLVVSVDREGRIYLNNTQVSAGDLAKKLRAITNEKFDTVVYIAVRGDKSVNYERVVRVVDLVTGIGFSKITLVTEPESKK